MADLTITATSVVGDGSGKRITGTAGETITAGLAIYKSSSTNKWMKAVSDSATVEAKTAVGIALNGAAVNQPVVVQIEGDVTIGATLTKGTAYYLSETPGGIQPAADVGAGENVCQLGIAKSTTVLAVRIISPGVTV
ncbi:MAG: hypothetical protein WBH00_13245 [Xanthobacteraceae bacterium]